ATASIRGARMAAKPASSNEPELIADQLSVRDARFSPSLSSPSSSGSMSAPQAVRDADASVLADMRPGYPTGIESVHPGHPAKQQARLSPGLRLAQIA